MRESSDQFVRYRALVLLTGFGDRSLGTLMRSLIEDRNDRVREVAYTLMAAHPDREMTFPLLAALEGRVDRVLLECSYDGQWAEHRLLAEIPPEEWDRIRIDVETVAGLWADLAEQTLSRKIFDSFEGQIWVNGSCTKTDEQCDMVNFANISSFD